MKKIVILLCFFGLFCSKTNAQDEFSPYKFGFQFSPTFSWMNSDSRTINRNGSVILGAKLGMFGEYYFGNNLNYALASGIGFAFNHSGKLRHDDGGAIWTNSDLSLPGLDTITAGTTLKYNLQYLEIPFSLKLKSNVLYGGVLKVYAEIPTIYLGINTQAKGTIEGNTVDSEKEDIKPDTKLFNLSWGVGGGVEYEVAEKLALVGGLHYQSGFTDVTKNVDDDKSKATIGVFIIRLGLIF